MTNSYKVSLWGNENVLKLDGSNGTTHENTKHPWTAHSKMLDFMVHELYVNKKKEEEGEKREGSGGEVTMVKNRRKDSKAEAILGDGSADEAFLPFTSLPL